MKKVEAINKLIKTANVLVGAPYSYGTTVSHKTDKKPKNTDCSSLMQYAYSKIGIELPRSSILQATKGFEIKSKNNLMPGDLIFFEATKGHYWHSLFNGKKIYIGHVVMYLGNGEILDASDERHGGKVAKMMLRDLTKNPNYKIKLIKRIIGFKEPNYNVPAYSQFLDVKENNWQEKSCGIISLKMVLNFWSKKTKTKYPNANELIKKHSEDSYINSVGWSHKGLVKIARIYNLSGANYDLSSYSMESAWIFLESKLSDGPLIASIHKNLNPVLSGHLVVITQIKNGEVYYNDPDSKKREQIKRIAKIEDFQNGWKKRFIQILA